jgi:hypothetical protein
MAKRKSFDADGVQFAWDSTSLTLASECLRKYYYSMILNLTSPSPSVHLLFGGAYASALEKFYKLRALGTPKEEALREIVKFAMVETFQYDAEGKPIGPVPFLDAKKSRLSLVRSLVWYVDQFGEESPDGIQTHHLADGTPAVELSFAVPFTDDLFYTGHLDRVVSYGGGLYWMDQKTTGQVVSPYYFDGFRLSNQFMGYTWAGQIVLHSPVKGGIIDAAQIAVNFTRFERQPITFTDSNLEEWRDQALYHIRAAQAATRAKKFPQNFTSCGNYGGCPYRELCKRSPRVREKFIEGDFVERAQPWDPLEAR